MSQLGCGPMSAKAKVRSRQWFCRGRARFICKSRAKARSKIPATSPWTRRVPADLARRFYVICEADQTFRAVPSGHGSGRNVAGREFLERNSVRQEFLQCDGFEADDRRALRDGRDGHALQGLLPQRIGQIRGVQPLVRAVRRRRRHGKCETARHRRTSGRGVAGGVSAKRCGQPLRQQGRLRSVRHVGGLCGRPQQWLHQLVAVGRRENHPDDEGADDALHLS